MNKELIDFAFGPPGVHRWLIKKEVDRVIFGWLSIWNGNCHTGSFTLDTEGLKRDSEGLESLIRTINKHCEETYDRLLYAYKYGTHKFIDDSSIVERLPRGKFTLDNFRKELDLIGDVFTSEQEFRSKALELL